jgi:hypothetical protein
MNHKCGEFSGVTCVSFSYQTEFYLCSWHESLGEKLIILHCYCIVMSLL